MRLAVKRSLPVKGLFTKIHRNASTLRARTYVNPGELPKDLLDKDAAFTLIAATPQYAADLIDLVQSVDSKSPQQIAAVAVDTIPLSCQRNGVSVLSSTQKAVFADATRLSESAIGTTPNFRGVTSGRSNWTLAQSFLGIDIGGSNVTVPAANTLFQTGNASAMLFHDQYAQQSGQPLSSLRITIPVEEAKWDSYVPLRSITAPLEVTQANKNLVQKLASKPAASFLESNEELMKFVPTSSADATKVFASITTRAGVTTRFKVEAGGGGGWSPRAGQLALDPTAVVRPGDKLVFQMAAPIERLDDRTRSEMESWLDEIEAATSPVLAFECAPVLETTDNSLSVRQYGKGTVIDHVFGLGSEAGFLVGDFRHAVAAECVWATV